MTQAVAHLLEQAEQLSVAERSDLIERLTDICAQEDLGEPPAEHIAEVRRRIEEVETGKVKPVSGDEMMARWHQLSASAQAVS